MLLINTKSEFNKLPPDNLRSEVVNEVLSERPSFLVRWGLSVFLLVFLALIPVSWFIRYPDIIIAKAKLTSLNAPKAIITKISGKLVSLNVQENNHVKVGDVIGSVESVGNSIEILKLDSMLSRLALLAEADSFLNFRQYTESKYVQLGELQKDYQIFSQALLTFCDYIPGGFFLKKKLLLSTDKKRLKDLRRKLEAQQELTEQDLVLEQKTMAAQDQLLKEKIISPLEYRIAKSKLIGKMINVSPSDVSIIDNAGLQTDKEKEMIELDYQIAQQKVVFIQALSTLQSAVENWKNRFLLISPLNGRVAFANFLQTSQQLQQGQIVCYINPENSSYYAEMIIPQSNFGKVITGQKVLLSFQAFPDQEYGSLVGKISFISEIPTDSGYFAKVVLPDGLKTNYQKDIVFRDGLIASSQIVTRDLRLLQRIYFTLIGNVKRK